MGRGAYDTTGIPKPPWPKSDYATTNDLKTGVQKLPKFPAGDFMVDQNKRDPLETYVHQKGQSEELAETRNAFRKAVVDGPWILSQTSDDFNTHLPIENTHSLNKQEKEIISDNVKWGRDDDIEKKEYKEGKVAFPHDPQLHDGGRSKPEYWNCKASETRAASPTSASNVENSSSSSIPHDRPVDSPQSPNLPHRLGSPEIEQSIDVKVSLDSSEPLKDPDYMNDTQMTDVSLRSTKAYESDWNSDESDIESEESDQLSGTSSYRSENASSEELGGTLHAAMSPVQERIVERIMERFWTVFQDWSSNASGHTGAASTSVSRASFARQTNNTTPVQVLGKRGSEDEPNEEDEKEQLPKRPRGGTKPRRKRNKALDFACHFKKHNPRKYNIDDNQSCCLGHWGTVARVKEHLYRRHQVPPQCQRCWQIFGTQEDLQAHLRLAISCDLKPCNPHEGITPDVQKQLRSRKKTEPGQSEADRWREIYQILFPGEPVPSPYFDSIQDERERSPGFGNFVNYEIYARREQPIIFRQLLEAIVAVDDQPVEVGVLAQMEALMRECQERTFLNYRSMQNSRTQANSMNHTTSANANSNSGPSHHHEPNMHQNLFSDPPVPTLEESSPGLDNIQVQGPNGDEVSMSEHYSFSDAFEHQEYLQFSAEDNHEDLLRCGCLDHCNCPPSANLDTQAVSAPLEHTLSSHPPQLPGESNNMEVDYELYVQSAI